MKNKIFDTAKFFIGWPLSLLALYFIWQMIAPQADKIVNNLNNLNTTFLFIAIICFIIFYFIRSYIWYSLIKDHSDQISFKESSYLWGISEIKRYIPGKFWFILGRTVSFSEYGIKKSQTAHLMLIELQIFAISSFIISFLALPFIYKYFFPGLSFTEFINLFIFIATIIGVLIYFYNQYFIKKLHQKAKKILNTFLPNLTPSKIAFLLFLCITSLIFYGVANYFVLSSITYLNPQLIVQLTGFFALSSLIGFLSFLTPAGLGIREGAAAIGLSKIIPYGTAAFGVLFARIILIISELIFIFISLIWTKIKSKSLSVFEKKIIFHPQLSIIFCLFLLYIIYFSVTSFLRYDNFYTGRFDLGNMTQTVWNTTQGRFFQLTDPNGTENVSRLAFHADFFLILLTPLYFIWSNPKMLLLIQAIIVGAGAFFVYYITLEHIKNKNLALTFSFIYLINPAIQRANIYDFHAVTLVTSLLLGCYYFYKKKKYGLFILFALLAAFTKEEIWLIIALFGIFIFIFHKKKLLGSVIFLTSVSIFYYLIWHAIPAALGSGHFALSYFSEYGNSPGEIIKTALFSPQKIIQTVFSESRLNYLRQLFMPVGFLSIFSPVFLLFALPDLLINLLSNNEQLHQIYYQYTAPISPFIFISSIIGASFLINKLKIPATLIIIYLLFISIAGAYHFGPLPGAVGSNLDMFTKQVTNKEKIDDYINKIPENLSISASNNIGSHLSHREYIYKVPLGIEKADVVIFLLTDPAVVNDEKMMIQKLKENKNYYIAVEDGEFIVIKKRNIL